MLLKVSASEGAEGKRTTAEGKHSLIQPVSVIQPFTWRNKRSADVAGLPTLTHSRVLLSL